MNKTTKILLIVTLVIAGIYFLVVNKPWSTFKADKKDFAISDTASITKIFLADKRDHRVLLEKDAAGIWMVNGEFKADMQKVNLVKATLHDVQVRNPLSESEYNSTIAMMASNAIKVECYAGEKLIKTVYVGGSTADQTGTFMMIEGAKTPYVTHIPGFVGYLTPRFSVIPIKWKDKSVFQFAYEQIQSVDVSYPSRPHASVFIDNKGSLPVVSNPHLKLTIPYDTGFVRFYLSGFTNLFFEGYDEDIDQAIADSIRQSEPYSVITVVAKDGSTKRLQVHLKPLDRRTKQRYDETTGEQLPYDTEKYIAFVDDEKQLVYIQHYNFGRLFKHSGDFVKRN